MVRRNSIEASTRSSMAKSELIRGSESPYQADLKFLCGDFSRLVQSTTDLSEKFESMESKLDTMLDTVKNTLSQLCNQLGIRPIEAEISRQPSPVIFSDAYVRDDPNRLPLDSRKSLLRKIEMPKFDGTNAYDWLSKVERFFSIGRYSDFDKLDLVALSLEGDALKWFNWQLIRRDFRSWGDFRRRLFRKFGVAPEETSGNRLFALKQKGSVSACVTEFEELSAQVIEQQTVHKEESITHLQVIGLDESHLEHLFSTGLQTEKKLILQYQEMDSTNGTVADVESANGANGANGGGDIDALPPPSPILPPNVEPLHVKTEPVEKKNLRVPVVSKILDQVHEPYHSDLDGKTFAYGGEKTVFTYGVLPDNQLDFAVVLEEVSAARSHGNASPNRNENELIHDNLKSHMWHKWKSKHLRPVFDLQTSPSYALDVVNKTSTPWETQNTFISTQVDSVHFLSFEVGTEETMSSGLSQHRQVWEPGGVLASVTVTASLGEKASYTEMVFDRSYGLLVNAKMRKLHKIDLQWARRKDWAELCVGHGLLVSWCGWMVFDRGKNKLILRDVTSEVIEALAQHCPQLPDLGFLDCLNHAMRGSNTSSHNLVHLMWHFKSQQLILLSLRILLHRFILVLQRTLIVQYRTCIDPNHQVLIVIHQVQFSVVRLIMLFTRCNSLFLPFWKKNCWCQRLFLVLWQLRDLSVPSWMLSQDFVRLYHSFKLEDKLIFGEGSIDTLQGCDDVAKC